MLEVLKTEKINGLRKEALGLILNGEILSPLKLPKGFQVYKKKLGFIVDSYNLELNEKIKLLTANDFPEIVELDLLLGRLDGFRFYVEIKFTKKEATTTYNETTEAVLDFQIYADLHNAYKFSAASFSGSVCKAWIVNNCRVCSD